MRTHIARSLSRTIVGPAAILVCSVSTLILSGCAMAPFTDTGAHSLSVQGTAFGGQPPVTGSSISLFATGSSGYGSTPSSLGSATTDASGNFTITGAPSCTDPQQVYIVASGGNPGLGAGTNNNALVLVAALGNCSSVSASTHVIINEVTTIAAAYALSGFASASTVPVPVQIGASATNSTGLSHAFLNAANIVNTTNGSARGTTPGGNGTVPANLINSLADILEPCVNSISKTSTACTSLFTNAHPPSATGIAAPVNTWQAALDMAQYPGNNTATLFGLISATPSFQPTIGATAPNDLSIGVLYSAGNGTDGNPAVFPWGIAADTSDNLWITGLGKAGLVELTSTGSVVAGNGGVGNSTLQAAPTHQVAVDNHGNILTVDNTAAGGNIYQYVPGTSATNIISAAQLGISIGLEGIAVDKSNNVWYATESSSATATQSFGKLSYNSGTNTFTPATLPVAATIASNGVSALTVDANTGTVWGPSQGSGATNYFFSPYNVAPGLLTTGDTTNYAAAIDKNADVWITGTKTGANAASLFLVSHLNPTGTPTTINATVPAGGTGLNGSRSIMIDGNGRIFVNSFSAGTIVEYDPSLGSSGTFFLTAAGNGFNPTSNAGTGSIVTSGARTMAIDATGALWTVNATSTAPAPVVQILGIAAPTISVLAQGKYGAKP